MFEVTFKKQGGLTAHGVVVGIMGSQLLIQYKIADGSPRERWLPMGRVYTQLSIEQLESLPKYKKATVMTTNWRGEQYKTSQIVPR